MPEINLGKVVGPQGPQGPKGDTGDVGPAGPRGEQGPKGDKGDKGDSSDSNLIFRCVCPTNKLIYDNAGRPGAYVYIPRFRLCDVLSTSDTGVHPAFIRDGVERDGFYMGKFQSHVRDARAYSLPAEDPSTGMTLDQTAEYCRAKGGGFHAVTAAEWAAVALWCRRNGTEPKGNNHFGRDAGETLYKAVPASYGSDGKVNRVAAGTGPVTWSHDGTLEGIWDLNGNVWEWCTGMRLVHGELQVIPWNNAAAAACDLSAASDAWKAINAAAASRDDLFVTPDGSGTTRGTVKMDFVNGIWTYSTTISHGATINGCAFASVSADAGIGAQARLLLMALAMLPDTGLTGEGAADYKSTYFQINTTAAECCLVRGGGNSSKISAGVFYSSINDARTRSDGGTGGRSAYQE